MSTRRDLITAGALAATFDGKELYLRDHSLLRRKGLVF
jgi:hypothetical protein